MRDGHAGQNTPERLEEIHPSLDFSQTDPPVILENDLHAPTGVAFDAGVRVGPEAPEQIPDDQPQIVVVDARETRVETAPQFLPRLAVWGKRHPGACAGCARPKMALFIAGFGDRRL